MQDWVRDVEVVHITPRAGARAELLAVRAELLAEYDRHFAGRYQATLTEAEDGRWIDIWYWADRADAERALANVETMIPSFRRWEDLVVLDSLTWSRRLHPAVSQGDR